MALRKLKHDLIPVIKFLNNKTIPYSFRKRLRLVYKLYKIFINIECLHFQAESLEIAESILKISKKVEGCIVECGCFKGGSSAKLNIVAKLTDRKFYVFDSFEGIPEHHEPHGRNILGVDLTFSKGLYATRMEIVRKNIAKFGSIEGVTLTKGWFKDTLPKFKEKIAAIFLDVDLVASTKDCLINLYPLLQKEGVLFTHDCDILIVIRLYNDDNFWKSEVGVDKPIIEGLGYKKVVRIVKK